jgi:PAS domain S-box-containing protein
MRGRRRTGAGSAGAPPREAQLDIEDPLRDGETWRLLLDAIADYAIFLLDESARVRTWNAGAVRMLGYSLDEIRGEHLSLLYPEDDVELGKPQEQLESALAEGRFEEEGWRIGKQGARLWANVIITPLRGDAGRLHGFASVARELTRGRSANERLSLLAERERIARELQGRAIRVFFDVGLQLEGAANRARDPDIGRHLERCVLELDEGITDLRRLAFDLGRPAGP